MKFTIALVSAKQHMLEPIGVPRYDSMVMPILERNMQPGRVTEASFTVLEGGKVVAGQDRRDGWLYVFTWWTYCDYSSPQLGKTVSGSIIEITDVNNSYDYPAYVLINQQ